MQIFIVKKQKIVENQLKNNMRLYNTFIVTKICMSLFFKALSVFYFTLNTAKFIT